MKDIYPEYADRVAFYAVGQDPTESLELMEAYRKQQGYPWPIAKTDPKTLSTLRVLQQSTKIAVDANGLITYRKAHGFNPNDWKTVFEDLASSSAQ